MTARYHPSLLLLLNRDSPLNLLRIFLQLIIVTGCFCVENYITLNDSKLPDFSCKMGRTYLAESPDRCIAIIFNDTYGSDIKFIVAEYKESAFTCDFCGGLTEKAINQLLTKTLPKKSGWKTLFSFREKDRVIFYIMNKVS